MNSGVSPLHQEGPGVPPAPPATSAACSGPRRRCEPPVGFCRMLLLSNSSSAQPVASRRLMSCALISRFTDPFALIDGGGGRRGVVLPSLTLARSRCVFCPRAYLTSTLSLTHIFPRFCLFCSPSLSLSLSHALPRSLSRSLPLSTSPSIPLSLSLSLPLITNLSSQMGNAPAE